MREDFLLVVLGQIVKLGVEFIETEPMGETLPNCLREFAKLCEELAEELEE